MITIEKLNKVFETAGQKVEAVRNITATIPTGQLVAIIGKSGSGKSTLLSLLGALDAPSSGSITVDDTVITKLSDRKLTEYRRNAIGFVFQQYNLVPNLSALENVMLPLEFAGMSRTQRRSRATNLLQQVGLDSTKHRRRPARLSGGEQQRVAIARALANRPKLILADEPTGNLDTETGALIFDLLRKLSQSENVTIIVVTHDTAIAGQTDATYRLSDGTLLKQR